MYNIMHILLKYVFMNYDYAGRNVCRKFCQGGENLSILIVV